MAKSYTELERLSGAPAQEEVVAEETPVVETEPAVESLTTDATQRELESSRFLRPKSPSLRKRLLLA